MAVEIYGGVGIPGALRMPGVLSTGRTPIGDPAPGAVLELGLVISHAESPRDG
ncbi:hypothetical protein [Streptomyces sp. NPDC060035]|uniref:hypothetical protein n=1 Tax=Streptomyces sp. NPDC060035 TaxID=3347044 RepID=UPI003699B075